ncbi:MAG: fused MFS/spermidine synthase, partial [Proteobacteria bacterium]|nr:fused MFS/spermidine synthase [Pseudomonadota bacterium]
MPNLLPPRAAFYVLFTVSGFAGLIYESIWTHYLKLFLGHAAYAQSLVLVVFMGGMALGSALCSRWSERLERPLLAYAAAEAVVGVIALGFHEAYLFVTEWAFAALLPGLSGDASVLAAKLSLACLLILPQSILLGATFPLMSAGLVRAVPTRAGESIAMLYFTNSLGAALGVLTSGFVLIAWVGLPGTLRTAGLINLGLAVGVTLLARSARPTPVAASASPAPGPARLLLTVALLTGFASFVYEIVWIRMLSLVLGASTHAFELMLSTFILGLALGGLAVRRHADTASRPERLLGLVQIVMGLLALGTLALYDRTFDLMEALMQGLARTDTGYLFFNLAGQGIAALIMLPVTICAGMTLPLITACLLRRGAGESAIGRIYAANTLGAIAGVLFAVHLGLPLLGLKGALVAGALVDAVLGLALLWRFAAPRRTQGLAAFACAVLFLVLPLGARMDANKMTAGVFRHGELASSRDAEILFNRDGKTATVHLVRYGDALSLRTNGKSDGSLVAPGGVRGTDEITMVLTAAVPLALKPDATSAAVIGIGTGLTTHTLLQSLAMQRVDTVEIEAEMANAARGFLPRNAGAFADPRGRIVIDDAKTFFAAGKRRYDLIISEPSNPWVSGVAGLFTREFYQRVRPHLRPGGLLVQWFQLYEVDPALLASVLQALGETFPHWSIYAPSDHDVLIVASEAPIPRMPSAKVFALGGVARELRTVHVPTPGDFDARYLGSRALLEPMLASWAMPTNSDFAPVLDLNAARHRFIERNATAAVDLLNLPVPVLELLEPTRAWRPVDPAY